MQRRHDIDWIRDITVLGMILYHSFIIFMTREEAVFFIRSGVNLRFCEYIEATMSRFAMPLLFILAGFSVWHSLRRRTIKEFVMQRVRKLLLPMLLVSYILNPLTSYIYGISIGRDISFGKHYSLFLTTISRNFEGRTTGFSPMHTWFLLYLFLFTIAYLPFLRKFVTEAYQSKLDKIARVFEGRCRLLLFVIPYPFLFLIEILGEMNPLGYLYLFFLGFLLATSERYQKALDRDKWIYTGLFIVLMGITLTVWFGNGNVTENLLFGFVIMAVRIISCYAILGLAHSFIPNRKSKVLSFLNGANFPIYLYHMLVLTIVGYLVLKLRMNAYIQFMIINIVTYSLCFGIYVIYQRVKKKSVKT